MPPLTRIVAWAPQYRSWFFCGVNRHHRPTFAVTTSYIICSSSVFLAKSLLSSASRDRVLQQAPFLKTRNARRGKRGLEPSQQSTMLGLFALKHSLKGFTSQPIPSLAPVRRKDTNTSPAMFKFRTRTVGGGGSRRRCDTGVPATLTTAVGGAK
jgi:hypothetical protein